VKSVSGAEASVLRRIASLGLARTSPALEAKGSNMLTMDCGPWQLCSPFCV
jgi:hypothetical protein